MKGLREEKQAFDRQQQVHRHRSRFLKLVTVPLLLVFFITGLFGALPFSDGPLKGGQVLAADTSGEVEVQDLVIETNPTPKSLRLVMVGDMLMHDRAIESGLQEDGTYNYDAIFAHTNMAFKNADIAIVNEEALIGGEELGISGYPNFNVSYELGDALVDAGFNVICNATNHVYDRQEQGILNSLDFWESNYPEINVLGIHHADDPDPLCLLEYGDITIGILNYTDIMNYDSISLSETTIDRLTSATADSVREDLTRANELADFVIVIPHWGTEYQTTVSSDQKYWAQLFLENGVDLVIGAHPHVIEPVEWLKDDEGHRMLVYYSLGNFISFTEGSGEGKGERAVGAMAQVTLHVEDGEVSISEYGVKPVVAHLVAGRGNPTVYFLDDYTQELAEESEMSTKDPTFSLKSCQDLCRQVFGELYQEN